MKLVNMSNVFTAFGSFAVFDEDTLRIINKVYGDCEISIAPEAVGPNNKAGKVLRIINRQKHVTITFRPTRLDVALVGMPRSNKDVLINNACAYFNTFSAMFEGCLASRIAYVSNDFSFDDNGEHMQSFIKEIKFIASTDNATELNIRYNTPVTISDEQFNCVTQISNVVIGNNNNPNIGKRKSIMISHDVNTLLANMSERFELNNLHDYFEKMVTLTHDKLESLEQID